MVIPAILSYHCSIRARAKVIRAIYRVGDGPVIQPVHADDVDGAIRHVVEAPHRRAADRAHRGQGGGQGWECSRVDEHSTIGCPGHVDLVQVHAEGAGHLVEQHLGEGHVIMAGGPVTGALHLIGAAGGIVSIARVQGRLTDGSIGHVRPGHRGTVSFIATLGPS